MGGGLMGEFLTRLTGFFTESSWQGMKETLVASVTNFSQNYDLILKQALNETIYMSLMSVFVGFLLAIIPGILLAIWGRDGIRENSFAYAILDFITNILRAFPFLILIIVLLPLSKIVVGTSIGTDAVITPLSIGIAPYLAKMIESAFKEVDKGVIEAAKSYGSSDIQIIFKVIFVEALPNIIGGLTLTLIFTIGFSALAGTIGGGGLGDVAIRYGYERFDSVMMIQTVVILLILVQMVQILGNFFYAWTKDCKEIYIIVGLILIDLAKIIFDFYHQENVVLEVSLGIILSLILVFKIKKQRNLNN
ncbi:methionine ABC transporter permease [Campylobacter upsaliensis]|uniref:ABC transporter permease n=3 Tax=Campylobacter TaxID=194 RepID=A0ABY3KZG9_9BACT|nr:MULTISPECIES: methionine ABC transporter permease [Campylobacter]MCR2039618.1 ABC transporter permease [Campylobacter helveticus]MCR2056028.1 ABC transporter permease [Campylobacter helveticus]MCR2060542.1 ABC transporter permease [Campylobacter helveticus]MCR2061387.1 ABC transporter permease [Campylobacter helveticus]MCR2064631.1 ABC transporter permease [Campylobacter helveticus]